jgi:hypothetical protein
MFATRLPRLTATRILPLLIACANASAAQVASPSADQWQSGGIARRSASSAVSSVDENAWRLPNGQIVPAPANRNRAATSNRTDASAAEEPSLREPREFSVPADAMPMAGAQNAHAMRTSSTGTQHLVNTAVQQAAAMVPAKRNSKTPFWPNTPHTQTPRVARAMPPSRTAMNPHTTRMRQRMNVAANEPEWAGESEELPLPGPSSAKPVNTADPFGPETEGYYLEGDGQHMAGSPGCCDGGYCDCGCCDGGCGGDCCCQDCCCGDCCEPGCGCACGDGVCGDECCNDCLAIGPGDDESCNQLRIRVPRWQELALFTGVHGFKNPYDLDRDRGNFGFNEGFNAGFKVPYTYVGYQIGYQAAQSQLNGTEDPAPGFADSHTQHFATFGLFRRTKDGVQFGAAWDTLVDRRHNARTFHQIRSEISWLDCGVHEFGLSATVGIMDHEDEIDDNVSWEAADQYLLFYRIHGPRYGEGRFFGGWTDDSDGIIGADMLLPIHDRWSVQTGFTYMIPDARDGADGSAEEAWNINLALVWHWGCTARSSHDNPYRPLFNVANNGTMIIDSR